MGKHYVSPVEPEVEHSDREHGGSASRPQLDLTLLLQSATKFQKSPPYLVVTVS